VKLIDTNILLFSVNRTIPQHTRVRTWLEGSLNGEETIGLPWLVLLGFLRIATNPRILPSPLSVQEALHDVDAWLHHPNTRLVSENEAHWPVCRELLDATGTAGNLTTDVYLAAMAIGRGATLASCDTDFARFRQLRWENPLDE
jgi:toxin-antitoxin system PIN domain toxin